MTTNNNTPAPPFTHLIDLAAERFGGQVLWCTDDFFAEKENLIKPSKPVFITDKYTERGKWMDGWESRRKRDPGHDKAVIQLGAAGVIKGFEVDTAHFLGNQPQACSIEACYAPDGNWDNAEWVEVLGRTTLNPGSQHFLEASVRAGNFPPQLFTHIKLHIYPDGGVARLRVYGEVQRDWSSLKPDEVTDLAAAQNGALAIQCNDMFFSHMNNLIMPGRGVHMGDGWETKRNRAPNNRDWVIVRLAHKGILQKALIDTCHFKGNYPDTFILEGTNSATDDLTNAKWSTIIERTKLQADHDHEFTIEAIHLREDASADEATNNQQPCTHVRLSIFPDGGVSRMRLWGTIV